MSRQPSYSTIWITGASAGLGEEFAWQLAGEAEHLVLTARREERLAKIGDELKAKHPGLKVTVVTADLANPVDRLRAITAVESAGIRPDLLINNAGLGDYGEFSSADWEKLELMIRVNMEAMTHFTHAVLPHMIQGRRGAILNVSSLASLLPIPDFAVYAATKAYVTSFSEALRIELREHGINVLALCPGPVHTEFGSVAKRAEGAKDMPGREGFYVTKQQVVEEGLKALRRGKARVFPAWKTAAAALVISAIPIILMRAVMARRPRRND